MKTLLALALAVLASSALAGTADSMRCGSRLVGEGDPKAKVADLCGKPTHTETRIILRAGIPRRDFSVGPETTAADRELLIHQRSLIEVTVDVWLYNDGPRRLMREVVFRDNRILSVNVLGRGY